MILSAVALWTQEMSRGAEAAVSSEQAVVVAVTSVVLCSIC